MLDLTAIKGRVELVGELGNWNADYDEDTDFILHAVDDVNALVAEVERLREENKMYTKSISDDTYDEFVHVQEIKKLRAALEKIAYTPSFEQLCDVEAYAVRVLEGTE